MYKYILSGWLLIEVIKMPIQVNLCKANNKKQKANQCKSMSISHKHGCQVVSLKVTKDYNGIVVFSIINAPCKGKFRNCQAWSFITVNGHI